jgi:dipeptidyl-peptidase 4
MKKLAIIPLVLLFAVSAIGQKKQSKEKFPLDDIFLKGAFNAKGVYGIQMMPDGSHYCIADYDGESNTYMVIRYSLRTAAPDDTLFNSKTAKELPANFALDDFTISAKGNYLLLQSQTNQLYRHSASASYHVFSIKANKAKSVNMGKAVFFAEISPDEEKVAYVSDNNLFVQNFKANTTSQITTDGKLNSVINGRTDWVYEEEFALVQGYKWSPEGDKIAFLKFDESRVKEYEIIEYDSLYPSTYRYKYPKVGEANSIVSLWIYDLTKPEMFFVTITTPGDNEYLPRFTWKNNSTLTYHLLNRLQNNLRIYAQNVAESKGGSIKDLMKDRKPIYQESSTTYVDITDNLFFLKDGSFLITSERGGFNNIYRITDGKAEYLQTRADVVDIVAVDEKNESIYYTSFLPDNPLVVYLYKVNLNLNPVTITPLLPQQKGRNNAIFSADNSFFIHTMSASGVPPVTSIYFTQGELVKVLEDNKALKDKLELLEPIKKEFMEIPVNGTKLSAWVIKPVKLEKKKKYPVLISIYGGPGFQTVKDEWGGGLDMWYQHLAEKGYIVVSVDNRGSGGKGAEFKKMTYKMVGQMESDDMIGAAKYFASLPYVDGKRIGIYGWSFGGYLSSLSLMKSEGVIKTAVAVAPVTDWRYYDNIYTERFMQTPATNKEGYDKTSVMTYVPKMKGNLLLIHGTFDDNVHPQNSMMLIKEMIKQGKPYDSEFYPDKNHSIYGGNTRYHLYSRITKYLLENL